MYFLKGLSYGIFLSILVGPLLLSLVQASMERGIRSGIAVGMGIWISDITFIIGTYWGLAAFKETIQQESFTLYVGLVGGLFLVGFGIFIFLSKPILKPHKKINASTYSGYLLQGFLVNTINPFTVIFWTTVTSNEVYVQHLSSLQAFIFFCGILVMIISTDMLKVFLAGRVRKLMKPHYILKLKTISGAAFVLFGIVLILRVVL